MGKRQLEPAIVTRKMIGITSRCLAATDRRRNAVQSKNLKRRFSVKLVIISGKRANRMKAQVVSRLTNNIARFNPKHGCWAALLLLLLCGCSPDDADSRNISGHFTSMKGVFHGEPKEFAERYCETCHGTNLTGGTELQPSCFQCHGRTWNVIPSDISRAPADHTTDMKGFRHHPQLKNPMGFCNACHGFKLEGGLTQRTPSCYLCHAKKW